MTSTPVSHIDIRATDQSRRPLLHRDEGAHDGRSVVNLSASVWRSLEASGYWTGGERVPRSRSPGAGPGYHGRCIRRAAAAESKVSSSVPRSKFGWRGGTVAPVREQGQAGTLTVRHGARQPRTERRRAVATNVMRYPEALTARAAAK